MPVNKIYRPYRRYFLSAIYSNSKRRSAGAVASLLPIQPSDLICESDCQSLE
jgi:hypothetical protein